jgi:hypothetical protein
MRRELLDRLEKLEQRQQNKYVPPPPIPLSMFLIAYFDGGWQPGESAADALSDYETALRIDPTDPWLRSSIGRMRS